MIIGIEYVFRIVTQISTIHHVVFKVENFHRFYTFQTTACFSYKH